MKIKYLGTTLNVNVNGQAAIARAKSHHGPDKKESFTGHLIMYKAGTATIIPMESYSVSAAMPNPVPHRGVTIGLVPGAEKKTYVMTSDGQVLASEVQTLDTITYPGYASEEYTPNALLGLDAGWNGGWDARWNGGDSTWMFKSQPVTGTWYFNHSIQHTIPEDCIYPAPLNTTPTYTNPDGLVTQWASYWQAGVTAFKARRKAWFKKNTTELMAALKGNFQPDATGVTRAELQTGKIPASWDSAIKTHCYTSYKTYQPILMTATYVDVVVSDTTDGNGDGVITKKRVVTFSYTDAENVAKSNVKTGHYVVTTTNSLTQPIVTEICTDWYAPYTLTSDVINGMVQKNELRVKHQFVVDRGVAGVGLLWNGTTVHGFWADSTWTLPGQVYFPSPPQALVTYNGIKYSNTLVGTAPDFVKTYHNTVLPKYHSTTPSTAHDGNTGWNNSGMYGVKSVSLRLFGPVAQDGALLGIFADPSDADGCTSIAYYGKATFSFDWETGALTQTGFSSTELLDSQGSPILDSGGHPTYPVTALTPGYSFLYYSSTLYFVGDVKTTIAGNGQTPKAAGIAASSAVQDGLPYTAAANAAAANAIQGAVAAAAPVDATVSPLVASPKNITAVLPAAVTGAVAAVLATYTANPPDTAQVKYYILSSLEALYAVTYTVVSYNYVASSMWPDVAEAVAADKKNMAQTDPLRALILSL